MNTKTIQTPQGLIVWDSFRGSFTMLMNTVALLIECKILWDIEGYTPKPKFSFSIHKTDGLQEETRRVYRENVFSLEYKVQEINDTVLTDRFSWFFNEYTDREQLQAAHQKITSSIDNSVTV